MAVRPRAAGVYGEFGIVPFPFLQTIDTLGRFGFAGVTLNIEEASGLELAMRKRQLDEGLENVFFWGKISGQEADYLIVYGYPPSMEYPRKQFYAW